MAGRSITGINAFGTTLVAGGGSNSIFFGRLRHADAFQRFAYKINAEYFSGRDWTKSDTIAVDDSGQVYMDNAGEDLEYLKTTGGLYFFPSPEVQVVASLGYGRGTWPGTINTGRSYAIGASVDYQELRLETPRFFAQAYRTGNGMGDTHAIEAKIAAMVAAANAGAPISEREAISQVRLVAKGYRLNYEAQYNNRFVLGDADFTVIAGVQHEGTVGAFVVGTVAIAGMLLVAEVLPSGREEGLRASSQLLRSTVAGFAPLATSRVRRSVDSIAGDEIGVAGVHGFPASTGTVLKHRF